MELLSVIIPVYDAAKYLEECLSSIVSQDYQDLEIICVDDGSSDASGDLLEAWASRDSRVKVLHQENKGLSSARNAGLDVARGHYVSFVDADDTIDPRMYSSMVTLAEHEDLDAVGCGFMTFPDGRRVGYSFRTGEVYDFPTLISTSKTVESSNDLCFCWRYIYKRSVIEKSGIRFREDIKFAEDMVFNTDALAHCGRIFLMDEAFYKYRVDNPDSLMKRKDNPERLVAIPLGYSAKKEQIGKYDMDLYSPCSRDLSEYVLKAYLPMLLDALPVTEQGVRFRDVKKILSLPMVRESVSNIGFRRIYGSWKEYVFYLAVKFRLALTVKKLYFK
ncbi:MAG: glycosyltransferase [Bacteroidales bacterium]|nr:glycosyltransferase [Bacteroidales bacterium]